MQKTGLVVAVVLLICIPSGYSEMRIWTSKKGQMVEAEFVSIVGDKVVLKTSEGKLLRVPQRGLCNEDREYLAGFIPPKLEISVDLDVDRYKQGDGYYLETKEENISVKVTIQKTNKEKCNRKFKAQLYLIAESITNSNKQLIGKEEHEFSFVSKDLTEFSGSGVVKSTQSYYSKSGYEYEGYIVSVEDGNGEIIAVESNQKSYIENLQNLKSARKGAVLTKNLSNMN